MPSMLISTTASLARARTLPRPVQSFVAQAGPCGARPPAPEAGDGPRRGFDGAPAPRLVPKDLIATLVPHIPGRDIAFPRPSCKLPMAGTRPETYTFGPIEVESDKYWGAQTQRSIGNF